MRELTKVEVGQVFGFLTVVRISEKPYHVWCRCDYMGCGKEKEIRKDALYTGVTQSCGCVKRMANDKKSLEVLGQRFGFLVAKEYTPEVRYPNDKNTLSTILCECDCGNVKHAPATLLKNGHIKSCGECSLPLQGENHPRFIHGKTGTRMHQMWLGMFVRCYNKNQWNYDRYGGRGIIVCAEWHKTEGFVAFERYMLEMYPNIEELFKQSYSIDRINVDGNYAPGNVKMSSEREQANNRSNNHYVEVNGEKLSVAEACRKYAVVPYHTVIHRLNRLKWDPLKSLLTPSNQTGRRRKAKSGE